MHIPRVSHCPRLPVGRSYSTEEATEDSLHSPQHLTTDTDRPKNERRYRRAAIGPQRVRAGLVP